MKKVIIFYRAISRHPGWLSSSTSRNINPFYQGTLISDSLAEFCVTYSIQSFQISPTKYLIGRNPDQKNKTRIVKTTIFVN